MLWHACAAPCGIRGFSRPPMSPGSRQKRRRRSSIRWQEPPDLRRWELPVQQEVRKSTTGQEQLSKLHTEECRKMPHILRHLLCPGVPNPEPTPVPPDVQKKLDA